MNSPYLSYDHLYFCNLTLNPSNVSVIGDREAVGIFATFAVAVRLCNGTKLVAGIAPLQNIVLSQAPEKYLVKS